MIPRKSFIITGDLWDRASIKEVRYLIKDRIEGHRIFRDGSVSVVPVKDIPKKQVLLTQKVKI